MGFSCFIVIEKEINPQFKEIEQDYTDLLIGLHLFIRDDGSRIFTEDEIKIVDKSLLMFGEMLPGMWY